MNAADVKVGDKVWYVPHTDYHLDTDHKGESVFPFVHTRDFSSPQFSYQKGEPVTQWGMLGRGRWQRLPDGSYVTPAGHTLKLALPAKSWPALVRAVFSDGTIALDIAHPKSGSLIHGHDVFERAVFLTLHIPDHAFASNGLRYSKTFEPHSWHFPEDEGKVS